MEKKYFIISPKGDILEEAFSKESALQKLITIKEENGGEFFIQKNGRIL